ncbi:hypothetical protein [Mucilaginibacter gotjawali]|uniref:Uncharacterized protein n=1 Tax=Mucilaginibacter gotjawali TaxID=1550579 RepID=A0A839S9M7_9SPHI|nr:hypothetical protein [Mucilaginibacter gotjawali]MBB3054705.1 hypothetical protein [Mucilaginibacter gotjawali]
MADTESRLDVPSRKKFFYPVKDELKSYLAKYNRYRNLGVQYTDLLRFNMSVPLLDKNGHDTLWQTVYYDAAEMQELFPALTAIYALMNASGYMEVVDQLQIAQIDYCTFGNSKPFRIRIINKFNDNYDYFYVKAADASRIYGLELEHILSPNRIGYLTDGTTIIEDHIIGLPGDIFIKNRLSTSKFNQVRICKEFVKFNERCFIRLLGDMRSYNYVVHITPDIEGNQYRIRAIDFDQQSYEGRRQFYLPHYFKENNALVMLGMKHMDKNAMRQYQEEERSLINNRIKLVRYRLVDLLTCMKKDEVSPLKKVEQLAADLAGYHKEPAFKACKTMGELVIEQLNVYTFL